MNIPPDNNLNDLNRDPPEPGGNSIAGIIQTFAIPLFGMAATSFLSYQWEQKKEQLSAEESKVQQAKEQLDKERKAFELEKAALVDKSLVYKMDELMVQGNQQSIKAIQEIEYLQPKIREVLKIRCSPFTPKERRAPLQKEIRVRLLKHPSPFDGYGGLKGQMVEDVMEIFEKDAAHCDSVLGRGDNGELYKLYRQNWRLQVELNKYKQVIEKLKQSALLK